MRRRRGEARASARVPRAGPGAPSPPASARRCPSSRGKVTQGPIDVLWGTCDCSLSDSVSCYLMRACVMSNEHARFALPLQRRHGEGAAYCLLFLPRSYVNMHWNHSTSGYRVAFRLWNRGILWPRVCFADYGQGITIPPVRKLVLGRPGIPKTPVLGNSLSKSDDTVFSGKSPLCWDTTEEGTLISCLHLIRLVDI